MRSNTSCRPADALDYFSGAFRVATPGAESATHDCLVIGVMYPMWSQSEITLIVRDIRVR